MTHAKLDYSGNLFALPDSPKLTRFTPHAIGTTLLGQDSVGVTSMSTGLAVYCGYEGGTLGYANGSYTTMGTVYSVFPGKKYVSVGRDAIDIEPGLASVSDGPGFVRNAKPVHVAKPVVYCSAGDLSAVIGALSNAGITRDKYFIWSAHWIGEHICGPGTCGYPQADGTQYGSNNAYDSDVFAAYIFGAVANPTFPLVTGDTDATANGPVHQLQSRLNVWQKVISKYPVLAVDGKYGLAVKDAVTHAQVYFGQRGVPAGVCDTALFKRLSATPPVTPPPPPKPTAIPAPASLKAVVTPVVYNVAFSWAPVTGAKSYHVQVESLATLDKAPLLADTTVLATSYHLTAPSRGKYRWRVSVSADADTTKARAWSAWTGFVTP